jgi:capsular exopolysaccharide synthesis family protein
MNDATKETSELRQFWDVLVRRQWVVYTVAGVLLAAAAVRTFTAEPRYRGTALVEIERSSPDVLAFRDILRTDPSWQGFNAFYETQYRILRSRAVARIAAQKMNLASSAPPPASHGVTGRALAGLKRLLPGGRREAPPPAEPLGPWIDLLLAGLSVEPVRDSNLVEVSFVSADPAFAARTANAVVDSYIEFTLTNQFDTTAQASDFLSRRVGELRDEVSRLEERLQGYREARRILPGVTGVENLAIKGVSAVDGLQVQATARRIAAESEWNAARRTDPSSLPDVVHNATVGKLEAEVNDLEIQRAELLRTFKPGWPQVQAVTRRMEGARSRLASETAVIAQRVVAGAEAKYRAALEEEERLATLLDAEKDSAQRVGRDSLEHATLQAEVERKRAVLNALLQRQNEASVSSHMRDMNAGLARVVDRALPARTPFRPRPSLDLLIGLLVGLLAGVGAAFGVESWDNTLRRSEDVERALGLPTLARIPTAEAAEGSGPAPAGQEVDLLSHRQPTSILAEAFRDLRTALSLSSAGAAPRLLAVTSTRPEEGKSTVAINLATVIAQSERRVLLVDSDLRRPRIHRTFGLRNATGLSAVLCQSATLEDAIQGTEVPGLSVLTAGPIPPNPAELLDSPCFDELVGSVLERFDTVVFDSAPLLTVADGAILASHAHGTVLVVESDRTTREEARRAKAKLAQVSARVLGVVLNNAVDVDGSYGRYRYQYQSRAAAPAETTRKTRVGRIFQRRAR